MTDGGYGAASDDEPLGRPFLLSSAAAPLPPALDDGAPEVRPYVVTGGRAGTEDRAIGMETVVVATESPENRSRPPSFEKAAILAACAEPQSVAELAARLRLPLGVARILVGDLVGDGSLTAAFAGGRPGGDVAFIERLIAGVAAL